MFVPPPSGGYYVLTMFHCVDVQLLHVASCILELLVFHLLVFICSCLFSSENVPCSAPTWRLTSSNRCLFSSQNVPCSAPTYAVLHPRTAACFHLRMYLVQLLHTPSYIIEPLLVFHLRECTLFSSYMWSLASSNPCLSSLSPLTSECHSSSTQDVLAGHVCTSAKRRLLTMFHCVGVPCHRSAAGHYITSGGI